jgi:anti-sigma B factor antagonist
MQAVRSHGIVSGAMDPNPDEIPLTRHDRVVELRPSGELDLAAAPSLRAALGRALESGATSVCVDLSAVTFLDSTGLDVFVDASRQARGLGISFVLTGAAANVRRVFDITNLGELLDGS